MDTTRLFSLYARISKRLVASLILLFLMQITTALADTQSERTAAKILHAKLANEDPEALKALKSVSNKDVVVVGGSMDHIEQVLDAANMRYTLVPPNQVAELDLTADQIVMVNCPGHMPMESVERIERFVRAGGLLYTTDWALKNVIEKAFPKTIKHNGQSTGDHVTPVHIKHVHHNLMSDMLLRANDQPQWWLEGGSYPISILDAQRVEVLAESKEMNSKYGAAPVVVRFPWHDGQVIHVVSHFYRQVKTKGEIQSAKDGVKALEGLTEEQKSSISAAPAASANMGDVASSYAFQRMTTNIVADKQKNKRSLDQKYRHKAKRRLNIGGRELQEGERLKVIGQSGNKAKVRDDRGYEAEISLEDLELR